MLYVIKLTMKTMLPDNEICKLIRAPKRKNTCVNICVLGHRDPRGPDNNIRVWVDKDDQLHIRVEKTYRCYGFTKMVNESGYVEIIAS